MQIRPFLFSAALVFAFAAAPATASPWAEVGDNQLRSDIELLASAGVIDSLTTHWPLPWRSINASLARAPLGSQPAAVRAAAQRVMARAQAATRNGWQASGFVDATNLPSVVYGFDGMARGEGEVQLALEGTSGMFSGRVALGAVTGNFRGNSFKLMPEGTYFSADIGGALVYGGYLDHWWGPGQISALQLSNNARPMPQIGIERSSTQASSWPVLNLLGPWQAEFFLAYMDGPRIQTDSYFSGARLTINPLPGLEMAMARTEEFCGQGHACVPIRDYFHFQNDAIRTNSTSDELAWDIKYSHRIGRMFLQAYIQLMNEDYSWFNHSGTSHLFGVSAFVPTGGDDLKLTVEYTNSIATHHPFSFGDDIPSYSYVNGTFPDGMRYRDRTLGFSLDDDSTLLSLQGSWTDNGGRFYELSLHHATIGTSQTRVGANILSSQPVLFNMAEARVALPLKLGVSGMSLQLAGRVQDDQPRPARGATAAVEMALRMGL